MTTKRKSINEIVGRSNENLAGASDRLLDIQIDFSPKSNYALDKQDDEIIPLRAAVQFKTNLDRQGSLINRKMDQFEVNFAFENRILIKEKPDKLYDKQSCSIF